MPGNPNGMNWIRQSTRLAIYLRDNLMCQYCHARGPEICLSLDHCTPRSSRGSNLPKNLVTACLTCNRDRDTTPIKTFVQGLWEHRWPERCRAILTQRTKPLDRERAKVLIELHGSAAKAVAFLLRSELDCSTLTERSQQACANTF